MKTLHIIRKIKDDFAQMMIHSASTEAGSSVLLMQDAVYQEIPVNSIKIYVCEEDLKAREVDRPYQQVTYDEIARLITEYDRTIVW